MFDAKLASMRIPRRVREREESPHANPGGIMSLVKHNNASPASVKGYDLLEKVGEGGMGVVWKASSHETGKVVAIKLIIPDKAASAVRLRRFEQEFRAAQRLDHPNIVRALDFGSTDDGLHYMVMEFVEGISLGKRIEQQGKLDEATAVDIIAQTGTALDYAHQTGVVHRDVKPDNILITSDGIAKLTDMGLVKVLDDDIDLTRPNSGLGTPNFMAPEQFTNAKHADHRCDIYSLGATLYMAVTGVLPFRASTPFSVLKKKHACELKPASMIVRGLSMGVESAIMRAINLDPGKRHANCRELTEEMTGRRKSRSKIPKIDPTSATPLMFRGIDRRAYVRHPSKQEGCLRVIGGFKEDEWVARISDVSITGIGLLVTRRFEIGTVLMVRLPELIRVDGPEYLFVRVVRQESLGRKRWRLGCAFSSPLSEEEMQTMA